MVGLGKIGLPLAVQYVQHKWRVLGCDINPKVVETINLGQSPVQEEPELIARVATMVSRGLLCTTTDTTEAVRQAEVVVVIVPVSIDAQYKVDFQTIDVATAAIGAGLQPGTLVIYETTLIVGTTAQRCASILERTAKLRGCMKKSHAPSAHDSFSYTPVVTLAFISGVHVLGYCEDR